MLLILYASLTCLSLTNSSRHFKSYITWNITNKVEVNGIKKTSAFIPLCSVLIKQVFIGLLPNIFNPMANPVIPIVKIIETAKYFFKFFPGFKIPSIGFILIFLKWINIKLIKMNSKVKTAKYIMDKALQWGW